MLLRNAQNLKFYQIEFSFTDYVKIVNKIKNKLNLMILAFFILKAALLRPKRGMGGFSLNEDFSTFAIGEYFSGTIIVLATPNPFIHFLFK